MILVNIIILELDAKIPEQPNKVDSKGKRTGHWVLLLDINQKETNQEDLLNSYAILKYESNQIIGEVEIFNKSEKKIIKGKMLAGNPLIYDGKISFFNPNGLVNKIVEYRNGKMDGKWIKFGNDGKVVTEGFYNNDERTGLWTVYYPNSKIKSTGKYTKGARDSIWTYYYEDGSVEKQEFLYMSDEIKKENIFLLIDILIKKDTKYAYNVVSKIVKDAEDVSKIDKQLLGDIYFAYAKVLYKIGFINDAIYYSNESWKIYQQSTQMNIEKFNNITLLLLQSEAFLNNMNLIESRIAKTIQFLGKDTLHVLVNAVLNYEVMRILLNNLKYDKR